MANDLPFVGPLVEGSYFLEPEELFGMKYALMHEGWPIPIKFWTSFPVVEHPVPGKKHQIVFTGYRPVDTYVLHKYFASIRVYGYNVDPGKAQVSAMTSQVNVNKNPEKRPFVGNRPGLGNQVLQFDSKFENGNLDRVVMISEKEYDIYIRSDTNAKKKFSWFYFLISNCKGKGVVKFNVVNMTDPPNLYVKGMKPVTSLNKSDWDSAIIDHVEYVPSKLNQFMKIRYGLSFYMLTFEIEFGEQDKWYVARSTPYTYSQLLKFLASSSGNPYFKHRQLCKSIGGLHVPKITITNPESAKSDKTYVLVTARLNPGESVSSYTIEGLIKYLLSDSSESSHIRNLFIFKLIPMCNPEGVVIGNSRTTVTGVSLHHKHSEFTDIFSTEPKYIKKLAYKLHSKLGISLYLDLAGSYVNLNSYCHPSLYKKDEHSFLISNFLSEFLAFKSNFCRVIPKNTVLQHFPLKHSIEKDLRIPAFVVESSIYGFKNTRNSVVAFDASDLRNLGLLVGRGVYFRRLISEQSLPAALEMALGFVTRKKSKKAGQNASDAENSSCNSDDSLESDLEDSPQPGKSRLSVQIVLKETHKQKDDSGDYNTYPSSDDEDLQAKDHLLESFQDFCAAMSKKKTKKNFNDSKKKEIKRLKIIETDKPNNALGFIRRKKKQEKIFDDLSRIKQKDSLNCTSINFSSICSGFKSQTAFRPESKFLSGTSLMQNRSRIGQADEKIFEMPSKHHLSQSVLVKNKESELPKFRKFGPFPDLQRVKMIKLRNAIEL